MDRLFVLPLKDIVFFGPDRAAGEELLGALVLVEQPEHVRLCGPDARLCRRDFFRSRHLLQPGELRFGRGERGLLNSALGLELPVIDAEEGRASIDLLADLFHGDVHLQHNARQSRPDSDILAAGLDDACSGNRAAEGAAGRRRRRWRLGKTLLRLEHVEYAEAEHGRGDERQDQFADKRCHLFDSLSAEFGVRRAEWR